MNSPEKIANDLRLLTERRADLQKYLDKYGPALATKPHPRFSGKSLRDSVDYALTRGSLTVVRETLASIRHLEEGKELDIHASSVTDSYIVAYGRTYGLNEKFQRFGFTLKKFGSNWAWFRETLADKAVYFADVAKSFGPEIETMFVRDYDQIESSLTESKEMDREVKASAPRIELESHNLDGAIFEITKWYSMIFKENNRTNFAFRNLRILKVIAETPKSYIVDAEFFSGIASSCGFCGLDLNNDISRACGIGPVCAKNHGITRPTMVNAKMVVAELEKLSTAQGIFKGVCVPKSQIKSIIDSKGNNDKKEPVIDRLPLPA